MKSQWYILRRYSHGGLNYLLGRERVTSPPIHVYIETTNICNIRCLYCPQSEDHHFDHGGSGKMSFETFQAIVDKLTSAWTIERIVLSRDGDPLVNKDLESYIRYVRSRGPRVSTSSNGTLMTEQRAEGLLDAGLEVLKGDLCADREYYEWARAGAKYDKALKGYLNILEAAKRKDAAFMFVLTDLGSYRVEKPEDAEESLRKLTALFPGYERWMTIRPAVMHNFLGYQKVAFSSSKTKDFGKDHYNRCHHPWLELVVDYQGNVVSCCRDLRTEYPVGNVLEAKDVVADIWNGEPMRALRRNLRDRKPEAIVTCKSCDLPYGESYAGSSFTAKVRRVLSGRA